jgi:uncharacterized protein (DUF1499 family)
MKPREAANRRRSVWLALMLFGSVPLVGFTMMFTKPPSIERPVNGKLSPCPDSPNCVCSHEPRESHHIEPLRFTGSPEEAWNRLASVLKQLPRTRVITLDHEYLHVEFTTRLLRFVDDVEFLVDGQAGVIHIRSASRVGHSDLGANRKRVEAIRSAFDSPTNAQRQ